MNVLSDETVLSRAISKKDGWIDRDTKEVDESAFILRFLKSKGRREEFLSAALTPEDSYKHLSKCYGVISFTVGNVRQLGLDAINDQENHVRIDGLPHPETDKFNASNIARKLARKATLFLDRLDNPIKK